MTHGIQWFERPILMLNTISDKARNTVSNAHKMIPLAVLYGKILILLWETPKSFE